MASLLCTAFQAEGGCGTYRGLKPPVIEIQASSLGDLINCGRPQEHSKLALYCGGRWLNEIKAYSLTDWMG